MGRTNSEDSSKPSSKHKHKKHKHKYKHKKHTKSKYCSDDITNSVDNVKPSTSSHEYTKNKDSSPTSEKNKARFDKGDSHHSDRSTYRLQNKNGEGRSKYDSEDHHRGYHKGYSNFKHSKSKSPSVERKKDHKSEETSSLSVNIDGSECVQHEDQDSKSNLSPDYEFNWDAHRYILDKIFFQEEDYIRRGTPKYDDFWAFLSKYQIFQRKKALSNPECSFKKKQKYSDKFNVPLAYDKRYRINQGLPVKHFDILLKKYKPRRYADGEPMSEGRLKQFRSILLHYMDFCQKQQFAKLQKIKRDQQNLPMYQYQHEVVETLKKHQVVVVAGDTGCGKSTQVPQYLLHAGFTNIACTQPRRIACISLARRVAYETLNEFGSEVAHQVRFEKSRTKHTRILFLTEGLLLRQMGNDPLLDQYSVVVIDEVHERHIHTDFLLGVIKCVLRQRSDLKLVLMSATINIDLFSSYFDHAPVVKVPGRLYPIELQYCPLSADEQTGKTERLDPSPYLRILQMIDHKHPVSERGDVLMFLSGMAEIMAVVEAVKMYSQKTKRWIVLALHSSLSVAEQDKVFDIAPEGVRKCIVSTNIAETSVTIDGVRFVVDSGKVKEMNFDPKYKLQRLQEFQISRASSEQRKGRAGRTGPGMCFRLYSEKDYEGLQAYSTAEIHRVTLDSLILQMVSMGMANTRRFPFIEPPSPTTIESSIVFLKEQGALRADETLTPLGEMLAQLPVDVIVGKMLIMASLFEMVEPVLSISAALSVQSPLTAKAHKDPDAMSARRSLESDHGDPLTLLNAYDEWLKQKAEGQDTRRWSKRRALEEQRFYEMTKLSKQFKQILQDYALVEDDRELREHMTAIERRQKTVERKRLHQLRNEQHRTSKKRKVLKMEDHDYEFSTADGHSIDHDDPADTLDSNIKDLEFRLQHDLDRLHEASSEVRKFTVRDLVLLKVILSSGLFPQVAIADEHNNYRPESEQIFHTKNKGFVVLHPTSIFALRPELLELPNTPDTQRRKPGVGPMSSKHQLIVFVSLLETTKPYLMGTMRVPALQTLLLFSNDIDTNADCTRLLFDGWLEVTLKEAETAENLLSSVVQLRAAWNEVIQLKLKVGRAQSGVGMSADRTKMHRLKKLVGKKLAEFLSSDATYELRRVLAAEMQNVYVGLQQAVGQTGKVLKGLLHAGAEPHPIKGGVQVTPFLTYNCLQDSDDFITYLQQHWTCDYCHQKLLVTIAEKLQHQQKCQSEAAAAKPSDGEADEESANDGLSALRKAYHCEKCQKQYKFTTAETLKHRKTCSGST